MFAGQIFIHLGHRVRVLSEPRSLPGGYVVWVSTVEQAGSLAPNYQYQANIDNLISTEEIL